jgi:hypothetical protein
VARVLAMTDPVRTARQWLDWLTQHAADPTTALLGMRSEGQWVGTALIMRETCAIAGQWLPVAEVRGLAVHPGMRWVELVRPLIVAASDWAGGQGCVLLRCEEPQTHSLATFGFVPQAPVAVVTCRPSQLARAMQAAPVRHAVAADIEQVAALYEARAMTTTGLDRRSPAQWQTLGAQLTSPGIMSLMVTETDGSLSGYVLLKKVGELLDRPNLQIVEWIDNGLESIRAIARHLSLCDPMTPELQVPLWPDRPNSLILGTSGEWMAKLRCGPSLTVLAPGPLLAAHLLGPGLSVGIGEPAAADVYAVAEGVAVPTATQPDVTMSKRVLAQLVGGNVSLAEAMALGVITGTAMACDKLTASWRALPYYRMPHP